jgi:hypothetical protein
MTRHPDSPKHGFDPYTVFVILFIIAALIGLLAVMWSIDYTATLTQLPTL